ncbi:hypothetical protein ITJ57_14050 [Plantibacter sp. VKM Ac-2880]|uniref:hypothetical protein n=1 Tax=Plantibacter sp. VKM Ac-2880 TaxID=2783827 RepID=UPI00188F37E9|nr:hypothetical protein [Plantibacter sp. VKM Ac-2880]MBF4569890.1 hypothetical protein [Plantibacter sp. VKM Ac-2880]
MRAPSIPSLVRRRSARRSIVTALVAAVGVSALLFGGLPGSSAAAATREQVAATATPTPTPKPTGSTPATPKPTAKPSTPAPAPAQPAPPTVRGTDFDPGEIISDENFYDANAMSEADVQAFFASQPCTPKDGVPCLADFRDSTESVPAAEPGHCEAYRGAVNESAARIVAKVAHACGINPKVLLVLMQKEQSLITGPSEYGYARAMGWGCPDTGPNFSASCDADYFGFQNQVYRSAWQFRQYTLYPVNVPGESYQRAYHLGSVYIQYSPDAACGGTQVDIRNQATANLYLYTPYQPNAAALANVSGTGDACSAYGNRNFWRLYTEWFGPAV